MMVASHAFNVVDAADFSETISKKGANEQHRKRQNRAERGWREHEEPSLDQRCTSSLAPRVSAVNGARREGAARSEDLDPRGCRGWR